MKRVLFVDDEPRILSGLQRLLRGLRDQWSMTFVESGQEALSHMAEEPYDVIVSDMRMPVMDGAELRTRVQEAYPSTVRIVLSGYSELQAAMRAVPVSHQYLTKPCNVDCVKEVITRAVQLQELLEDSRVHKLVSGVDALPVRPSIYGQLVKALSNPDVSVEALCQIVEQDAALCVRLLQIVNSSFFGIARSISSIKDALTLLGINMLKNLALSAGVFRQLDETRVPPTFSVEAEHRHALETARVAMRIVEDGQQSEDAFMAAVLHDLGRFVLAVNAPEEFALTCQVEGDVTRTDLEQELEVWGVTHAEVGAYLIGLWGLPYNVVEAVAYHHCPSRAPATKFDVLGAVHVAEGCVREYQCPGSGRFDLDYLQSVRRMDQLESWKSRAAQVLESAAP